MQFAKPTKGGSGPSGMDVGGWKRILTSKQFAESSIELQLLKNRESCHL